ncbi:MAG TPA: isochorismatase family cysteine hydrolase [bacterium]|jgi:ureidoacrylate peracid hydrolase|nr:isochorismatase family cysteine hydrolase [bacterium]
MAYTFDVNDTALLVIDAQNAFLHPDGTLGISGVDLSLLTSIIPKLRPLIEACKARGIPDIWSLQYHLPNDQTRGLHRIQPHTEKRARIVCQPGTWDAEIIEDLKPLVDSRSHIIEKHKFSVFYNTRLEVLLRILGRRTLIVSGSTTNACIDTSIREAYMRDYDLLIVSDCIGGVRRDWHEMALAVWAQYCGAVVRSEDLLAMLSLSPTVGSGS